MNTAVASVTTNDCKDVSFFIVESYQVNKFKMDEYIFIVMYHLLRYCGGIAQTDRHTSLSYSLVDQCNSSNIQSRSREGTKQGVFV